MDDLETILYTIRNTQAKLDQRLTDIQIQIEKARLKQQEIQNQQAAIQQKQEEMQIIIDKKDNRLRAMLKRIEGAKK